MTLLFRSLSLLALISIMSVTGIVMAQTEDRRATSSLEAIPIVEKWYQSEQLSGEIDMGDFVVGPGRSEIEVSPGDVIVQEITVTNRISENREFKLEVEDVTGSVDGSSAVTLSEDEYGPYSIRDYISFPEDTFVLKLGERARIPVTITIPPDAEPGGFYGSILVSTVRVANTDEADVAPRSPVIARVGSLFFVTVRGEVERSGQTKEVTTIGNKSWYQEGPIDIGILYENSGSVHLNPYGEIAITNMFGEQVGFIELEPWFVLPKSLRLREVMWDREFLLGRYTITAKVNRGYDDVVDELQTSFWVVPWSILVGVFVGVFILVFGLRLLLGRFKRKS